MSDNVNETEGLNEVPGQVFVEEAIPLPPDMEEPAMTEVAPEVPQDDTAKEDIAEDVETKSDAIASDESILALSRALSEGRLTDSFTRPEYDKSRPYSKFLRSIINDVSKGDYSTTATILATRIHSRENAYGLWEEGGAISKDNARALLIGDANGHKLPAIKSYYDDKVQCGRHALLEVKQGYHIAAGVVIDDKLFIFDYVVTDVITKGTADDTYVEYQVKLAGTVEGNRTESGWDTTGFKEEGIEDGIFLGNHPMIEATIKLLNEIDAHTPAYIVDYLEHAFHLDDYLSCINNASAMENITTTENLQEAYANMNNVLGDLVDKYAKDKANIITLTTSIKYYTQHNLIAVFLFPMVFNLHDKKIVETGNYIRVVLQPGSELFYIDNDTRLSWDVAVDDLLKAGGNTRAFTVRRITGRH